MVEMLLAAHPGSPRREQCLHHAEITMGMETWLNSAQLFLLLVPMPSSGLDKARERSATIPSLTVGTRQVANKFFLAYSGGCHLARSAGISHRLGTAIPC
jgi:hypothetical protein